MSTSPIILLVEDDPNDIELTLIAFEKAGVDSEINIARDGQEAVHYLYGTGPYAGRDPKQSPAVVLLDLQLPKIDGHEVLRRMRADERTRRLPVVVLTSSVEQSDLVRSYDLGANSFVRKPVDFVEFSRTAKRIAEYWLTLNITPRCP